MNEIPKCNVNSQSCGYIKRHGELLQFQNEILKLVQDFNMELEINENISDVIRRYINRVLNEYHKSEIDKLRVNSKF